MSDSDEIHRDGEESNSASEEFVALVSPFRNQLLAYLYSILRNADDAEDVLQLTHLELWRKFDQYDRSRSMFVWAREIARLQAIAYVRKNRRHRLQFGDALVTLMTDEMLQQSQERDEETSRLKALRACMNKLKPTDRELILSCYRGDRSHTEIAQNHGRSPQSLSNSLRRIRLALYECIRRTRSAEDRR
jgi:RNA polymerase sigma-70 factor (ECF subfamily)